MSIYNVGKCTQVMWQKTDSDYPPEPAIVCTNYHGSGVIELQQEHRTIRISYGAIDELCRMMKAVKGMKGE